MHFVGQWEEISVDTYILEVVRSGYCLEFKELPPPTGVIHTSMPGSIEKVRVIEKRNSDSVAKECHRKSSRKRKIVGFLQYNFSDKEKIRRIAPHSKSKQSKSLPAAFPFPNGNPTINYKKPTTGRMDNCNWI